MVNFTFWAFYPRGKKSQQYPLDRRLGELRSRSESCGEEKDPFNLPGFEHGIVQVFPLSPNWLLCPSYLWFLMNNDMDRKCKDAIWYNLKYSSNICLEAVSKPRGTSIRWCVDRPSFELHYSWLRVISISALVILIIHVLVRILFCRLALYWIFACGYPEVHCL